MLQGKGLLNGRLPDRVYSLWNNVGTQSGFTSKAEYKQLAVKMHAAADIGDHEISFGFEYEQRKDSYWGMYADYSWDIMRLLANKHILELDSVPIYKYVDAVTGEYHESTIDPYNIGGNYTFQDTIFYNRLFVEEEYGHFGQAIRDGLGVGSADYVDIDYLDPETFSVDMFSADELLNEGNPLVLYNGYDARGNVINSEVSLQDFFTNKSQTAYGEYYDRLIPAFQPVYVAGFIQDKFAFDDLIFSIGLRVDRYDANQSVLADEYCLYDTYSVNSNDNFGLLTGNYLRPVGIGDDFVVYVNDIDQPTEIVGYRNGNDWYDQNGESINDPKALAQASTTGQITPYLVNPEDSIPVFKDYEPQTDFSPRISFSFPISDQAQFFAHYDVLTQRPPSGNRLEPIDYLYLRVLKTFYDHQH